MMDNEDLPPIDTAASTDAGKPALASVVVEYEDQPDECTIFPANGSEDELVTAWLSAADGSFVDLDEVR